MMLWMDNIEPGTSDDDLRAFVRKYSRDVECVHVRRLDGNGSRPAALLSFVGGNLESVPRLAVRLHGMYWHGRPLSCGAEHHLR
ncbi:MAG: RNA-binding protein [Burkholderiales bacterium]